MDGFKGAVDTPTFQIWLKLGCKALLQSTPSVSSHLKAHCRGADWINKTIKKKRISKGSVILLYCEIHEDDNDLIPFLPETKYDPRA